MIKLSQPTKKGFVRFSIRVIYKGKDISKNIGVKVHKSQLRRKKIVNHPYANELNKKVAEELFKVRELVYSLEAGIVTLEEVKGLNKGLKKDLEKDLFEHIYNTKSNSAYNIYTTAIRAYKKINNQKKLQFCTEALNNLILNYEGSGSTINTYVASIKALNKEAYKLGLVKELIERLDNVMHIDEVLEHLKERVLQGDIRAIKLWLEYRYGRPNTTVAMETTTTNINFKELINWD